MRNYKNTQIITNNMKLAFIIPALDEEKNISRVLGQFKRMKGDYEVIVADGGSRDKTVEIAKKFNAKIVSLPREKQNIAKNRNNGARHADADILVFCDADTIFEAPGRIIPKITSVMKEENIVGGMPKIKIFPDKRKFKDEFFLGIYNEILKTSFYFDKPFSSGQCQIVRKKTFDKIKGYDENIVHGEDTDLFARLKKKGELHYFSNMTVYESPRRYRHNGYIDLFFTATKSVVGRRVFKKNSVNEWKRVD